MSFILQDSSTALWTVGVTDTGLLTTAPATTGTVATVILRDSSTSTNWQLGITTGGLLTTTSTATAGINFQLILSPNSISYELLVAPGSSGQLQTQPLTLTSAPPPYNVLDTNGVIWNISITTSGELITTPVVGDLSVVAVTTDLANSHNWTIGVNPDGSVLAKQTSASPNSPLILADAIGNAWQVGVLDSTGAIYTQSLGIPVPPPPPAIPCVAPMPLDVVETIFGLSDEIFHQPDGSPVLVRADFGIWCCDCQAFVTPESTNMLVILDE